MNFLTLMLLILTTFSSCTVRKAIQAESKQEITQTLNPIKSATVASSHCFSYDEISAVYKTRTIVEQSDFFSDPITEIFISKNTINGKSLFPIIPENPNSAVTIPLYILFRQIKAFV
ncbi:hypothetical protein GM418_05730 [Maribellus comscasis]|uniref:Lipoprotein n=1 Tax=Maribellus comscasis TaxID=2681766 RepID=A0A6I6JK10_9BACT|nr:hypothetical protein [Maribellus comscasis]QGY43175.1 hypothetical protein GM418_05730 [Maribellus comscasis]